MFSMAVRSLTEPEDVRIARFVAAARETTSPEDLAKLIIEAGWAIPGDPPVERWPAYPVVLAILQAYVEASQRR